MKKIIDIHTHHTCNDPTILEVIVPDLSTYSLSSTLPDSHLCIGLHPWHIPEISFEKFSRIFSHYLTQPQFFALGEIGLDKACGVDYPLQKEIFYKQLKLANKFHIKRIIIHSVRAHSDILEALKKENIQAKILIHDFYAKTETIHQYLKYDCYFSFGKKLFHHLNAQNAIQQIPRNRIFLETDDQQDYNILEIYQQAAKVLSIDVKKLVEILYRNYQTFKS